MVDAIGRENGTICSTATTSSRYGLSLMLAFAMLLGGTAQVSAGDLKNIVTDLYGGDWNHISTTYLRALSCSSLPGFILAGIRLYRLGTGRYTRLRLI